MECSQVIVFTTMERDVRRGRHGIGSGGGKLVGRLRCEFAEQGQTISISGGDSIHTAMSAQVGSAPALGTLPVARVKVRGFY